MAPPGKKLKVVRQYSVDYIAFGFVPSPADRTRPMCLICSNVFSNEGMKPSRMRDHLEKMHSDKKDKPAEYFKKLRDDREKTTPSISSAFAKVTEIQRDGLLASYNIANMIAKAGKPHTVGETLILPAVKEVISTVLHRNATEILKAIPLSNDTVSRRIDEMASDVEIQLVDILKKTKFSIQLDESTLSDNTALLMSYVRYFNETGETKEEMLFAESLPLDTTGTSIFAAVKKYFEEKEIPLINIHSCATDGAPAMVGRYKGFLALLKKEHPDIICIHCVAHREHLAAKRLTPSLHDSLNLVITAVNVIKTNAKSDRLFRNLCQENDEIYNRLLLHTEVRWLSKGNCLARFCEMFDSVVTFLQDKREKLAGELKKHKFDIFYLAAIFRKLNELSLQIQGKLVTLIDCKSAVTTFIDKLALLRSNILRKELYQFPEINQMTETPTDEDLLRYGAHLQQLKEDFTSRFQDLIELDVPAWITDPFGVVLEDVDVKLQEELVELRNNEDCKVRIKTGIKNLWQNHSMAGLFPTMWEIVHKLLLTFPTSYLVETGFSAATFLHSDKRKRLDMINRGDLRLYLTLLTPRVKELVSKHQPQGSH